MLKIRAEQYQVLVQCSMRQFYKKAVAFVGENWPEEFLHSGEDVVYQVVQRIIHSAQKYGIEQEYHLLRYINIAYALEEHFDISAEYPWARTILENRDMDAVD